MIGTPEELSKYLWSLDINKNYEIKEYKQKRSLTANAYAWTLIGKLADAMRMSKDDMYLIMLKNYGQSEIVSILSKVNPTGYFKYYEAVGTGMVNNKEFTHYRVYKGSSEFDTMEMSIFIDGIIQECTNLKIPTLTKEQIESMRLI